MNFLSYFELISSKIVTDRFLSHLDYSDLISIVILVLLEGSPCESTIFQKLSAHVCIHTYVRTHMQWQIKMKR